MVRSLALLAAVAGAASAADSTTTVSLLLPMFDPQPLVASVVKADATITAFAIACAPDTPAEKCGVPGTQVIWQGPSTWSLTLSQVDADEGTFTQDVNCKLDSAKDVATCDAFESRDNGKTKLQSSTQSVLESYLKSVLPVTVTAGVDKLSAAPGATATGSGANPSPSASAGSSPSASATGTNKGDSAASASTTASTKSGNAAAAMVTQNAVLAGVAAVVGGAMML